MKRSEMEKIIKTHLANQFNFELEDNPYDLDYEARLILTIVESHGMLPPATYKYQKYDNSRSECNVLRRVNEWDEEKE